MPSRILLVEPDPVASAVIEQVLVEGGHQVTAVPSFEAASMPAARIKPNLQFKGDALALRALLAGELDSYEGSPGAPIIAGSRGADIKITGCYWPGLTYGIYARPTVAKPEDLKDKAMAISSPGALPDLMARAVLEKYNIASSDVRFSIMGSDSDLPVMLPAAELLKSFGIPFELTIVSAHRTPNRLVSYATKARERGLKVIIAGAGGAAHLPGMVASLTTLPVIGVPIRSSNSLDGWDSILSILQMPNGIPVATR